jgi:hypothetical protein
LFCLHSFKQHDRLRKGVKCIFSLQTHARGCLLVYLTIGINCTQMLQDAFGLLALGCIF